MRIEFLKQFTNHRENRELEKSRESFIFFCINRFSLWNPGSLFFLDSLFSLSFKNFFYENQILKILSKSQRIQRIREIQRIIHLFVQNDNSLGNQSSLCFSRFSVFSEFLKLFLGETNFKNTFKIVENPEIQRKVENHLFIGILFSLWKGSSLFFSILCFL